MPVCPTCDNIIPDKETYCSQDCYYNRNADRKGGLTIAALVSGGYSWDRIISEIEELKLLCANCHRKQHHPWFRSE